MSSKWQPKPGDQVIRHPRKQQISPVKIDIGSNRKSSPSNITAPILITSTILIIMTIGAFILLMPFSNTTGEFTPILDAIFTSTSATTVTGLTTQNSTIYWSWIGKATIVILIYIGGLGIMTLATFFLILMRQKVSLSQRIVVANTLQINEMGSLVNLTLKIVGVVTTIQLIGAIILYTKFSTILPPTESIFLSIAHSVSSFNNAGFVFFNDSNSLEHFQQDHFILSITSLLIFLGSIGYWVFIDSFQFKRISLISLNSKIVLIGSLFFILLGATIFFFSEFNNSKTIGDLNIYNKISVSFFQSISGRTAGFSVIDHSQANTSTNFFYSFLMIIGGGAASVSGGIKINTFAIIAISIYCNMKGKFETSIFARQIPIKQLYQALSISSISIFTLILLIFLMTFDPHQINFSQLLFDTTSAFGTVGATTNIVDKISNYGKTIFIISMFTGRILPFSLASITSRENSTSIYHYAEERITIG
ncbi:MAG: hypothetical protein FI718_04780 [SAR202 cluster bacterium]|nr:hypothetical protein [SAR202 cluster bacterium]MQG39283.1 hypothetical protein [SAR202 cluster bacterium]